MNHISPSFDLDAAPSESARIAQLTHELALAKTRIGELEELAHFDELTGILNRRGFNRELRRALSYTERYGVPVSLLLVDLDLFKQINDQYGHPAGDAVLARTATVLSANLRASDVVARLGGDEFALLLWHATPDVAAEKAVSLEAALAHNPAFWRGATIPIGASLGIHGLVAGQSVEDALHHADRSLYAIKQNRVVVRR